MATSVVQQRAYLQHSADVVTLAFAQRGEQQAQLLATIAGVKIVKTEYATSQITVTIRHRYGSSRASAYR